MKQALSLCLSFILIFLPLHAVDLKIDTTTKTTLSSARNGVPIVNIANPNSTGLSHNKFKEFNVAKDGLILNNSRDTTVNTQLGGYIYGNKNLISNAKVILNEVTSSSRSQLNGYIEVAGKRADLVIANPNGITINGAGFINTSNITLTTGTPIINSGRIDSFNVIGGNITVEGIGLDARTQDSTEIYAHYLKINAAIYANNLNIKLGKLDSSSLGGMYANRISLVGTKQGLGVNLPPEVLASSGDITITNDGYISLGALNAYEDIQISTSENIKLNDTVLANNIEIVADTLDNRDTTIYANNNISLTLDHLENIENAPISSGNDINLNIETVFTNSAKLSATNNLNINAQNIINDGLLNAANTLTINSENLTNNQTLFSAVDMSLYVKNILKNLQGANIYSVDNLTLSANQQNEKTDHIINENANIQTLNGDIDIWSKEFTNKGNSNINYTTYYYNLGNDKKYTNLNDAKTLDLRYDTGWESRSHQASNEWSGAVLNRLSSGAPLLYDSLKGSITNTTFMAIETRVDNSATTTDPSLLESGHNLNIHVDDFLNRDAVVVASNNILLDITNSFLNIPSSETVNVSDYKYHVHVVTDDKKNLKGKFYRHSSTSTAYYIPLSATEDATATSLLQAGNSITGTTGKLVNDGGVKKIGGFNQTDNQVVVDIESQIVEVPTNDYGLFIKSPNLDSSYLIETNPEFALYENFISSDYLMSHIDYDAEATTKRLGDAFYENTLIRDSLFSQTGKRFLSADIKSNNEQFKYLMDNAIEVSEDLELSLGISLSIEQVNALTKDIVWMEERIVQGKKVLVPVVYIANLQRFKIQDAKIIVGKDLNLDVKNLENSGSIVAGKDIDIDAIDSILNSGGVINADENMRILAKNNITNRSGTIKAKNIDLTSTDGSIVNQRATTQSNFKDQKVSYNKTMVGDSSNIQAINTLTINVKKDILVQGSELNAKDINLNASNVNISTTVDKKDFFAGDTKNYIKEKSTIHIASNINADNININSTETATIKGSSINTTDNLNIKAAKIDVIAVNNTSYNESKTSSKDIFKSSERITKSATSRNQASSLNAKNLIFLTNKDNIDIIGSKLAAKKLLALNSAKDVNVNAGYNIDHKDSRTVKTSMFSGGDIYSSSMDNVGLYDKVSVSSNLNAKDIKINSKNTNITGSNLVADNSIDINAENINIQTVKDEHKIWEEHEKISLSFSQALDGAVKLGAEMGTLSLADTGSNDILSTKASYSDTKEQTTSIINQSSNINAGEDLSLKANRGNINIVGSNLTSDGDTTLDATNNINILVAYDKNTHSYKETSGYIDTKITINEGMETDIDLNLRDETDLNLIAKASTLNSNASLSLKSKYSTNVIGSSINSKDSTTIQTDGELKIAAAKNRSSISVDNLNIHIYAGGIPELELGDGQIEIELGRATVDKIKKTTTNTTATSSNINADEDITLDSKRSILVEGSNLNAKEEVVLNAEQDITIKETKEISKVDSDELHGVATAKFVIANEYAKIPYAVLAVKEAKDGFEDAKENYKRYKKELSNQKAKLSQLKQDYKNGVGFIELVDVEEFEELVDNLKEDDKYYNANIALAVTTHATKTTALVAQIAKAAASSATYGFSAGIELDIDAIEKQLEEHSTASVASNIKANVINIEANNKASIQGSSLQAKENITIDATNTDILASKDNYEQSRDEQHQNVNISISTAGFSMSASADSTESNTNATNNSNSKLLANNININTKETTNIIGANLSAKENLTLKTKNLNVASVQDTSKTREHSIGLSAGFGASGLSSLGANSSHSNSKSKQTIQTDLTGNKVDIAVQEHTNLKAATIASVDEEEMDNNKLNFKTSTITASSLNNTNNSKSTSIGIQAGVTTSQSKNTNKGISNGTTEIDGASTVAIDYSSDRTSSKTKNLATLGLGNIQIGNQENSDTKMLNRDVENNTVDIYNISSHKGLKGELDTRLLTSDGREEIAKDTQIAGKHIAKVTKDMPVVGRTLTYQTKDGQKILLENGKLYKYNSEAKREELSKGDYVVYKSGMLNTPKDTKEGYQEFTDGTVLRNYKNVILVNNQTHLFGIADGLESAVGYIGIPTGNAFQTQEFNEAANKLGTIVNLTHSQANIVEKNANRLHFREPLSNIYTISIGSPEYAGKDKGQGNTLNNASQGAGANFIGGFNNVGDGVSTVGLNTRENANKDVLKGEDGHEVEWYKPHLLNPEIKDRLEKLLNIEGDKNANK